MPSFSTIEAEISNILDVSPDDMDEEQKALWSAYAAELGNQEADKVDRYGQFRNLESARADALEAEGKRLIARSRSIRNNLGYLDSRYVVTMRKHRLKKISGELYAISLRATDIVNVTDMNVLPAEYIRVKTTTEPDKLAIKDALKQGIEIPGAMLEKSFSLRIS